MRSILFFCALSSTGYGATVTLKETVGDLCPDPAQIAISSEGGEATLASDLTTHSLVSVENELTTLRRSCTFRLQVEPTEGETIDSSSLSVEGNYSFGRSGRIFLSVAERTLAGEDVTISHALSGRHGSESGSFSFGDTFPAWEPRKLPCGKPFEMTVIVAATSRKVPSSSATTLKLGAFSYALRSVACSSANK